MDCDEKSNICLFVIDPMCLSEDEWIETCIENSETIKEEDLKIDKLRQEL